MLSIKDKTPRQAQDKTPLTEVEARLDRLTEELAVSIFGTAPNVRPRACICADIWREAHTAEGRATGYGLPWPWLPEWDVFRDSRYETERRALVDNGWLPVSVADEQRYAHKREVDGRMKDQEAALRERLKKEAEESQRLFVPLTLRS